MRCHPYSSRGHVGQRGVAERVRCINYSHAVDDALPAAACEQLRALSDWGRWCQAAPLLSPTIVSTRSCGSRASLRGRCWIAAWWGQASGASQSV